MHVRSNYTMFFAGVLGLTLLAWSPASAQKSVASQITAAHTGATKFSEGLVLPLQRVWSYEFPAVSASLTPSLSYPIIANGTIFVTVADFGASDHKTRVAALSLQTGQLLWTKAFPSFHFWSAAAYDAGRLFVITDQGDLRALNPRNGNTIWKTKLTDSYNWVFNSPPTARDGMIYLSGTGNSGTLFAVDQNTGEIVWRQLVWNGDVSSPTLSDDGVFVSYSCQVYKFDPRTGAQRWHYSGPCSGGGGGTAVYYSGLLFARYAYYDTDMLILNADNGRRIKSMADIIAPPAIQDGIGYLATNQSNQLSAVSLATGNTLWQFTGAGRLPRPPIVVNGKVMVTSEAGELFVLDGTSGNVLQRISLGKRVPITIEGTFSVGLGAGEGMIIVPADNTLIAFKGASN